MKYHNQTGARKRTNVHICAYTFFFRYVIILVTFGITNSTRFYLVLRCQENSVLATIIRKLAIVRLSGRIKRLSFTNFCLIGELFKWSPRKEKAKMEFKLHSEYQPTGDQPQAIEALVKGFQEGNQFQTLLGVTGSGKTFTMANVIQQIQKPTLIIAHNKTLAAQLYSEFKEFFPENAVEYFVSYYEMSFKPLLIGVV